VIQAVCNPTAQAKGKSHAGSSDAQGDPPVAGEKAQVDLQSDEEQEQNQAQICCQ
jgi:hypothetical protein